jgi:hypothetical protein
LRRCCGRLSSLPTLFSARGPDLDLDQGGPGGAGPACTTTAGEPSLLSAAAGCPPVPSSPFPTAPCVVVVEPPPAICQRGPGLRLRRGRARRHLRRRLDHSSGLGAGIPHPTSRH